jgi:hypothetical protein
MVMSPSVGAAAASRLIFLLNELLLFTAARAAASQLRRYLFVFETNKKPMQPSNATRHTEKLWIEQGVDVLAARGVMASTTALLRPNAAGAVGR